MAADPARRLDGWKAIANHLGRDVRTAQRWRDERALPVYRLPGRKGGAVFADRAELDAWLFRAPTVTDQLNAGPEPTTAAAAPAVNGGRRVPRLQLWSGGRLFIGIGAAIIAISGIGVVLVRHRRAKSFSPPSD